MSGEGQEYTQAEAFLMELQINTLKAEVEGLKSQLTNEKYILDQLNNSRQKLKEAEGKLGKAVEFIKQLDRLEIKQDTDSFLEEIGG